MSTLPSDKEIDDVMKAIDSLKTKGGYRGVIFGKNGKLFKFESLGFDYTLNREQVGTICPLDEGDEE